MGFYYCPITPSPVWFSIQIFRRGLKFLKFSSMNQYIKLTIWYFFLKICWGYCPHFWLLGCPRPAFLLIARFPNIIINKHSKHLLYVHILDRTTMFTFPYPHNFLLTFPFLSNAPCQGVKQLWAAVNETWLWSGDLTVVPPQVLFSISVPYSVLSEFSKNF